MANTFSNFDDTIDSRDVIARIEELEGEREALQEAIDEYQNGVDESEALPDNERDEQWLQSAREELGRAEIDLEIWDASDEAKELAALKALADEASGYAADWLCGKTLIRDSYFRDYAMELAEDIHGNALVNLQWPMSCIDWDQAARELQCDYTAVDFDGVTYWIR